MTDRPDHEPLPPPEELESPTRPDLAVKPYDARQLLIDLEPTAARLLDRHLKIAEEWFPHDYIPYSQGRDFDKEPWTPDQPRLSGVARTAFEVNLLTEDNLPSYHRLIYGMFGEGDGAWINWVGRWTAEEGRHSIVLRDYLTVTRNLDPTALEQSRMAQLEQGYERPTLDPLRGLAYVALQEVATRAAHRNTGRYSDDPVADRIMVRISTDENLHATFYRDILAAAAEAYPSATVEAVTAEILGFEMPGAGIKGFRRKAAEMALAGIYDLRIHYEQVVMPLVKKLRIFELSGLTPAAEAARAELGTFLEEMVASARRLEERRARAQARANA
ncbi:MAG: acyl-ACP desaturase [Candidatus Limnocylindrales bacterium]